MMNSMRDFWDNQGWQMQWGSDFFQSFFFGSGVGFFGLFMMFGLIVWSLVWKGLALWKAAKIGHRGWFVALLVVNTLGILEILYLYVFSKNCNVAMCAHVHNKKDGHGEHQEHKEHKKV